MYSHTDYLAMVPRCAYQVVLLTNGQSTFSVWETLHTNDSLLHCKLFTNYLFVAKAIITVDIFPYRNTEF